MQRTSRRCRIFVCLLTMLIGGYGAAQGQTQMEMEMATKMEEATNDFLGLKWGAGIGVMGGFGGYRAVEKASLVGGTEGDDGAIEGGIVRVDEEADLRPQLFLEMHVFLAGDKVGCWRDYQKKKAANQMEKARDPAATPSAWCKDKAGQGQTPEPPLRGFGPFVALQSGDNNAIDSLAVGVMWGFRKDPQASASVNVGIGLSFDPSVQVLGDGLKEGKELPSGETAVRFKKEGRFGWALMTSFTF